MAQRLLPLSFILVCAFCVGLCFWTTESQAHENVGEIFEALELEAKSVYVLDLQTGQVLWQKEAEAQLPLASLTKLMTAYAALRAGVGEEEQVCFTLVTSSNTDADILGSKIKEQTGREPEVIMNEYARQLGMAQTFYLNPSGLDVNLELAGAYGSAHDQALLLGALMSEYPQVLSCTTKRSAEWGDKKGSNTNKELSLMTGIVGSKTGFTDLAGGNLGVVFDAGIAHPVAVVVLGSGEDTRFTDIEKLITAVIHSLGER